MWNKLYLWFDRLSLLKKVILVPIATMILSALMTSINYKTSNSIAYNTQSLYKELIPVSESSTNNKFLLNQMVENFANAVFSSEVMFIEQTSSQAMQIRKNLYLIEDKTPQLKNVKAALESFEKYYKIALSTSKFMVENNSQISSKMSNSNELFDSLNETKIAFENLDNEIKNNINVHFKNIEYTIEVIVNNELYTIIIMYLILFIVTFFIYKNINKKFKLLLKDIVTLSKSSLESRKRIEKVSNDELGILTSSLNEILDNYENNVTQLNKEKMDYFDLSHRDKLTNLFNRHYLDSVLVNYEDQIKDGFIYGIIIIDIDNFKQINDTFGHQIGDEVLKVVAEILTANTRKVDIVGRWGGEEFLCIIMVNDKLSLYQIAENLRQIIEKTYLDIVNHITASFGCALLEKERNSSQLIENADKALYKAKKSGKNRVEIFILK